ncbi:class I SAM-dependent methyltransferase [Pseudomonadales bacterium]|nr:class I SAM-dependent methyltransferase [Pseudomonadales bacterium]
MVKKKFENWQLLLDHVKSLAGQPVILDYGCGAGAMVERFRDNGFETYGCDVVLRSDSDLVLKMNDQFHIPYQDEKFDLIISNQVVEHVHDLRTMISEFNRVLKPNGQAIILCPTLETVFEWHLMVPFVHWFNNYHFIQKCLLRLFATLGLGRGHSGDKDGWVTDRFNFLQNFTRYRSRASIIKSFNLENLSVQTISHEFYYKKYNISVAAKLILNRITLPYLVGSVFRIDKKRV